MLRIKKRYYTTISIILLIYSIILINIRIFEGSQHTLLWITHTSLFLATIGFLTRKNFLISSSLIAIFLYHILWTIDFFVEFIGGGQFLNMTGYLHDVSTLFFIFTLHHIWLSPLLFFILYKEKRIHHYSWLGATSLFFVTSLLIILLFPYNVNCAHTICSSLENTILAEISKYGSLAYFILLQFINALIIFLPINLMLRYFIEKGAKS